MTFFFKKNRLARLRYSRRSDEARRSHTRIYVCIRRICQKSKASASTHPKSGESPVAVRTEKACIFLP